MSKLEDIAESTVGKIAARWITPICVGLLVYMFTGLNDTANELERSQWKIFGEVEHLRGVTQERLDGLKQRMDKAETRMDKHEVWFGEIWRKNINE